MFVCPATDESLALIGSANPEHVPVMCRTFLRREQSSAEIRARRASKRHFIIPSGLVIYLGTLLYELDGLHLHTFFQRGLCGETFLGGEVAHVLRDFH